MKFAQLFILVLAFLIIKPASAGLLIEPLVGFSKGELTLTTDGINKDKGDFTGMSYGGRLGYQQLGFQLGLDYLNSNNTIDDGSLDKITSSEWGGFVGFEFPVLLRVYAGYIFSATGEGEDDSNNNVDFIDGTGTKFGIGFTGLPFVDINLEYRSVTFGDAEFLGSKIGFEQEYDAYMLSFSLPFVL
jgi:hypothetical protein